MYFDTSDTEDLHTTVSDFYDRRRRYILSRSRLRLFLKVCVIVIPALVGIIVTNYLVPIGKRDQLMYFPFFAIFFITWIVCIYFPKDRLGTPPDTDYVQIRLREIEDMDIEYEDRITFLDLLDAIRENDTSEMQRLLRELRKLRNIRFIQDVQKATR